MKQMVETPDQMSGSGITAIVRNMAADDVIQQPDFGFRALLAPSPSNYLPAPELLIMVIAQAVHFHIVELYTKDTHKCDKYQLL